MCVENQAENVASSGTRCLRGEAVDTTHFSKRCTSVSIMPQKILRIEADYMSLEPGNNRDKCPRYGGAHTVQPTRYYLWKTNDSAYETIITFPAYQSFTFPPTPRASLNVTIKVPFALLNLTLDMPILERPTPHFSCHAYTPNPDNKNDDYRLGRAFLQAAYLGHNWAS
jgi:hypothetical protein